MQQDQLRYAGFWRRALAIMLDGLIIGVAVELLSRLLFLDEETVLALSIVLGWLYFAFMESSDKQATLGKQALGIIVTDLNGNPISFPRATGRYFAKNLSTIILFIGFIMAGFTEKKQALHDIIASTLVVKKR